MPSSATLLPFVPSNAIVSANEAEPDIGSTARRTIVCHGCGSLNEHQLRFCEECGTRLEQRCPGCQAPVRPGKAHCGNCGTSLAAGAASCFPRLPDTHSGAVQRDGAV